MTLSAEQLNRRNLCINVLEWPDYNPEPLFLWLFEFFNTKTQDKIAEHLCVKPSVISRQRNRRLAISGEMIIRIHEATGLSTTKIKQLLGLPIYEPQYYTEAELAAADKRAEELSKRLKVE